MADDSGGEVVVRLSQEGGDAVVRQLQEIISKLGEVGDATKRTAEHGEKAGTALSGIATSTAITAVAEFGEKVWSAGEKIAHYAEQLIEARSEQEQFLIRMASLDEKTMGWTGALANASENLHTLAGMSENLTFDQLIGVFQKLKLLVGGTNDSLLDLTQRVLLFAEKAGVGADQMLRVIQMAERTGTLPMRGDMANASLALKEAGITGDDIRRAAQEGGEAMDQLLQKVQVSKEASETLRHSWVNLKNDLASAADVAKMTVGAGFDPLKGSLEKLTEAIEKNGAGWERLRDQITTALVSLKELVAPGGEDEAVSYWQKVLSALLMLFTDWLTAWKTIFAVMVEAIATGVDVLQSIIKNPFNIDEHLTRLKDGLNSSVEIAKDMGRKFRDAWDEATGTGDGDTGPRHHATPEEDNAANGFRPPIGPDDIKRIEAATEALDKLYQNADRQHQLAGLSGLGKELQQIENAARDAAEQLADAYNRAVEEGWKPTDEDSKRFDAKKARIYADAVIDQITRISEAQRRSAEERVQDEKRYTNLILSMEAGLTDDVIQLNLEAAEREKRRVQDQIDDYERMMIKKYALDADTEDRIAAVKEAGKKKQEDIDARAAAKNAEIAHLQSGQWAAYYDDLTAKAVASNQNLFVAAQENSRRVAGEMTKAAETAEQGWQAGLATIYSQMTSFGQDVSRMMTGVWASLTNAFEEGFYDILSGKFDSLKDVLKSLWDSILKDFSKMLAQMLERWLLTGDAMGNGQGGGGFSSILGLLKGGNQMVSTPGGTAANAPGGGYTQYGDYIGTTGYEGSGGTRGGAGGGALTGANVGALAAYGVGLYQGISSIFEDNTTSNPTYQGQSLGQTADFGGPGGGQALAAAGTVIAAAAVATAAAVGAGLTIAAAAASVVPVIGWIAAAVLLVVAVIMEIFSGKQEGHIYVAISDAFDKTGARSVIGGFVAGIIDSTTNFVGQLALKAAGPEGVQKYMSAYQNAFKEAYGNAKFDLAAGSPEDLQKDVENFFKTTLPTMAMRAAFGQIGYDPNGNRDAQGGMAGLDWNMNNPAYMDKDGNWVKKQLYDPNAPIPAMLTGLGFSADRITEIATKLASGVDIETFKRNLMDLVGAVVDLGELSKQFGRTTQEWFDFIHETAKKQGTAAQFTKPIENLKAQGLLLDSMFGDEKVAAAKELVTSSATLLQNMGQALAEVLSMIDQIKETTATTIQSYRDKLKTPLERENDARGRIEADFKAITDAANPKDVQKAWQTVMRDLSTVLDAIVARIQAIKALQQGYADFRDQIAKNAGPQFATDPQAWLAQNQSQIDAIDWTDPVKGAQELLRLTKERYENELQMLARVNSAIDSISERGQQTSDNLRMQAMGHVETDAQGNKKWVADTHAQGDYLKGQYDELMGQLANAKTPEEVQKIYNKMQGIISQLASQPQDPEHYAESRTILANMNDKATKAATDLLKKWGKDLDTDLAGTGDKLSKGETALATALEKSQKDFEKYLGLMSNASVMATDALTDFADGLTNAMRDLQKSIDHWTFTLTHGADEKDPNWDYEKNKPKDTTTPGAPEGGSKDVWEDDPDDENFEICTAGPHKGNRRRKKGTKKPYDPDTQTPGAPANATTGTKPATEDQMKRAMAELATKVSSRTITVNVGGGTPEEIAEAVKQQVLATVRANNVEIVRTIRNNPSLTASAY